jgi:hypothetical protein
MQQACHFTLTWLTSSWLLPHHHHAYFMSLELRSLGQRASDVGRWYTRIMSETFAQRCQPKHCNQTLIDTMCVLFRIWLASAWLLCLHLVAQQCAKSYSHDSIPSVLRIKLSDEVCALRYLKPSIRLMHDWVCRGQHCCKVEPSLSHCVCVLQVVQRRSTCAGCPCNATMLAAFRSTYFQQHHTQCVHVEYIHAACVCCNVGGTLLYYSQLHDEHCSDAALLHDGTSAT